MARRTRSRQLDTTHFGVSSVLERLLIATDDIQEELAGGGIEDERFFGHEYRLKEILRSLRCMKDILGDQLYLNIATGVQEMLSSLKEMGDRVFECDSYSPNTISGM